jgi:hypothetical protein
MCDKTEPQCLKCQKKGIRCSGQGLQCRFSSYMTTGGSKPAAKSKSKSKPSPTEAHSDDTAVDEGFSDSFSLPIAVRGNVQKSRGRGAGRSTGRSTDRGNAKLSLFGDATSLFPAIYEPMHPQARMLFDHFSRQVAPLMVVYDFVGNGYRDIILPLAVQDDILRRAVCVVAAFHLAQTAPHFYPLALTGHQALVEKLSRNSKALVPADLLSPSNWATIIVLLVGETISGADNYVYLLEMLTCLHQSPGAVESLPVGLRKFILQQTKMFELLGFPLSNEAKAVDIIQTEADHYLEFMTCPTLSEGNYKTTATVIREATKDACLIYQNRARSCPSPQDSLLAIEMLRRRVLPIEAHVPGAHALVWTYFVAAADSVLPEHRQFFSSRLRELHGVTSFGSIPTALRALETIWEQQETRKWTEIISKELPVLVM